MITNSTNLNPNLSFKYGTQAKLNELRTTKKATTGTFYLTNDTHRFYVGTDTGDAVPVNEGISIVTLAEFNALTSNATNAGQFVYISDQNILAVSTGANGWVQINSVKDTTYTLDQDFTTFTETITDDDNKSVTRVNGASIKIILKGSNNSSDNSLFTFEGENGVVIAEGTADGQFQVYGPSISAVVDSEGNKATIGLQDKDGKTHSSIKVMGGTNVTISGSDDVISVSAIDTKLDGKAKPAKDAVQNVGFKILATDTAGATSGSNLDPIIRIGANPENPVDIHFNKVGESGIATLPVYTKSEIDAKYLNFNAMTYKGVFEGSTFPASGAVSESYPEGIKNGDTYIAGTEIIEAGVTENPLTAKIGDLIIATGTEDPTTGLLTAVTWEVVPAGNEDTTYQFKAADNGLEFYEKALGATAIKRAHLKINGDGSHITVEKTVSGNNVDLKVKHNLLTTSKPNAIADEAERSISVSKDGVTYRANDFITHTTEVQAAEAKNITTDDAGHVSKIQDILYKVKDTNARIHKDTLKATGATAGSTTKAVISHETSLIHSSGAVHSKGSSLTLQSDTIKVSANTSGDTVSMDLVWGTF